MNCLNKNHFSGTHKLRTFGQGKQLKPSKWHWRDHPTITHTFTALGCAPTQRQLQGLTLLQASSNSLSVSLVEKSYLDSSWMPTSQLHINMFVLRMQNERLPTCEGLSEAASAVSQVSFLSLSSLSGAILTPRRVDRWLLDRFPHKLHEDATPCYG